MTDVIKTVKGEVVASLEQNEETIRRGLATFVEVGNALAAIRDQRQYRELGYENFDDYCRERWDMSRRTADYQIAAAEVVLILDENKCSDLPRSESVARPLVKIMEDEGVDGLKRAWGDITTKKRGDRPVTASDVKRYRQSPANYGGASWHELIGDMGDRLNAVAKRVGKLEAAINRKPSADFMEKADEYAALAEEIAARLRSLGGDA